MTGRPLLITDCDEVLLHMVSHFDAWLDEAHNIDFAFESGDFGGSMTDKATGALVSTDRVWPLLDEFFRNEMHRQTIVPGAVEALGRIAEVADIVILPIWATSASVAGRPLAKHGIAHDVVTNSCREGVPSRAIIELHRATAPLRRRLPATTPRRKHPRGSRLHMVAEPRLAPAVPTAEHAHVRIDDWPTATDWLLERLRG